MIHQWFRQAPETAPFLRTRISSFSLVHSFPYFTSFSPHIAPAPASLKCLKTTHDRDAAKSLNVSDFTTHKNSARETSSNSKFFATIELVLDDEAKYKYSSGAI